MKKNRTVLIIAEISILAAFALVLDYIAQFTTGFLFPVGGSIGVQMIPVILISYRRGILPGIATGLIIGLIQFAYGGWYLNIPQFILDYPLPYALVGLSGGVIYINKHKINYFNLAIGAVLGGLLKYFSHYLSGVVFWKTLEGYSVYGHDFADSTFNYNTWSLFYNGTFMIPSIILSTVVIVVVFRYAKQLFIVEENDQQPLEV